MTSCELNTTIAKRSGNTFCSARHIRSTVCRLRKDIRQSDGGRVPVRQPTFRAAFTLIELVIVVLILGIMAAVAAPRYRDSLAYFRVEAAAQRIVADLHYARRLAKHTGVPQSIEFTLASHEYTLPGVSDPDHPLQDYVVNLSRTQYPASLVSVDFDGNSRISFNMYGQPYCGAPWAPLTAGSVVVQAGSEQRTITIEPNTGKTSVQ